MVTYHKIGGFFQWITGHSGIINKKTLLTSEQTKEPENPQSIENAADLEADSKTDTRNLV